VQTIEGGAMTKDLSRLIDTDNKDKGKDLHPLDQWSSILHLSGIKAEPTPFLSTEEFIDAVRSTLDKK